MTAAGQDSTSGLFYDCSAHMLWVGERTRQLDGAHIEFLCGVADPLGIKVSDKMKPTDLVKLIEILNPSNKPGRITIITMMGAENMRVKLPHLIRVVCSSGQIVTWITDPMHGNYMWLKYVPSSTCMIKKGVTRRYPPGNDRTERNRVYWRIANYDLR